MMNDRLTKAYMDQIALEFESSHLYLQAAAWFDGKALLGFAGWMRRQADEERNHGLKFLDFVLERGNEVTLQAIPAPAETFADAVSVFRTALAHEQKVTKAIEGLYELALAEKDYASMPLLQWFLSEQVEEENTVRQILEELEMAGDNASAILILDRELATRGNAE